MRLFSRKTRSGPVLSREQALACTPVRSREIEEQSIENGLTRIVYPMVVKPFVARVAARLGGEDKPFLRTLELDEIGTASWEWIDGNRTVRELSGLLARRYDLHRREAEVAMTAFLRELGKRGIIGFREGRGKGR